MQKDWARSTEDDMVRDVRISRADSPQLTLSVALERYLSEITPTKRATTAEREKRRAKALKDRLGKYSLTALTPDIIASYRDARTREGRAASSVRVDLALLSHLYATAIREWRLGLVCNPVALVRKPSRPPGATGNGAAMTSSPRGSTLCLRRSSKVFDSMICATRPCRVSSRRA